MQAWIALGVNALIYVITFAIWIGKSQAQMHNMERREKEINSRIDALTALVSKQPDSYVHNNACRIEMQNLERRLNEINSIDLGARLARMETKIDNIETTLKERKS